MVAVTTAIPVIRRAAVINLIHGIMLRTPSVTPRPKKELAAALKAGNLAVAFDKDVVVGWLISTPYGNDIQEIGMAYIKPAYRNQSILNRLIDALIGKCRVCLAVTYEERLVRLLTDRRQFDQSSLAEFALLTKGAFVADRLKSWRVVLAVVAHTSQHKPTYLVRR